MDGEDRADAPWVALTVAALAATVVGLWLVAFWPSRFRGMYDVRWVGYWWHVLKSDTFSIRSAEFYRFLEPHIVWSIRFAVAPVFLWGATAWERRWLRGWWWAWATVAAIAGWVASWAVMVGLQYFEQSVPLSSQFRNRDAFWSEWLHWNIFPMLVELRGPPTGWLAALISTAVTLACFTALWMWRAKPTRRGWMCAIGTGFQRFRAQHPRWWWVVAGLFAWQTVSYVAFANRTFPGAIRQQWKASWHESVYRDVDLPLALATPAFSEEGWRTLREDLKVAPSIRTFWGVFDLEAGRDMAIVNTIQEKV